MYSYKQNTCIYDVPEILFCHCKLVIIFTTSVAYVLVRSYFFSLNYKTVPSLK